MEWLAELHARAHVVHLAYSDMEMFTGATLTNGFYGASYYRPPDFVSSVSESQKIESVFKIMTNIFGLFEKI